MYYQYLHGKQLHLDCSRHLHTETRPYYQIRKIAGRACTGHAGNFFPRHWLQRKPLVSITACASRSFRDACRDRWPAVSGKIFPEFPAHVQPAILRIWQDAHAINKNSVRCDWFHPDRSLYVSHNHLILLNTILRCRNKHSTYHGPQRVLHLIPKIIHSIENIGSCDILLHSKMCLKCIAREGTIALICGIYTIKPNSTGGFVDLSREKGVISVLQICVYRMFVTSSSDGHSVVDIVLLIPNLLEIKHERPCILIQVLSLQWSSSHHLMSLQTPIVGEITSIGRTSTLT